MREKIDFADDESATAVLSDFFAATRRSSELSAQSMMDLEAALPVLQKVLSGNSGQSAKVRQIIWSLYTCDHLVPLGDVCSGLDPDLAEAVATAIFSRLFAGAEIEEPIRRILSESGEFRRCDEAEAAQAVAGTPLCYPIPKVSAKRLHELAESAGASEI